MYNLLSKLRWQHYVGSVIALLFFQLLLALELGDQLSSYDFWYRFIYTITIVCGLVTAFYQKNSTRNDRTIFGGFILIVIEMMSLTYLSVTPINVPSSPFYVPIERLRLMLFSPTVLTIYYVSWLVSLFYFTRTHHLRLSSLNHLWPDDKGGLEIPNPCF